eukprot:TRINITY_DN6296_c0_g1_i1.p1 TRINITY_DN6296_c0_g1~~TRINITY_DN6296_c0_g1_i1.p1  ORF type:complete len:224 (+),score=34.77 TRINITY_DN6296_c0_g1_i1:26-673(+)
MWKAYLNLLARRPVLTKTLTSGFLYAVGDGCSQVIDGTYKTKYDTSRTLRFVLWGLAFGPLGHAWYNGVLEKAFLGASFSTAIKKTLCDQFIFAPVVNGLFLLYVPMMAGKTLEQARQGWLEQYKSVMKANWSLWPWVQLVNFKLIPGPLQLPFINVVLLGWSTFLALVTSKKPSTPAAPVKVSSLAPQQPSNTIEITNTKLTEAPKSSTSEKKH